MNKHTRRAVQATMAAAGVATLGVSFVGSAAAMDMPALGGSDSGSGDSYGSSDAPDSMLGQNSPGVDNQLMTFEMPRVETASYSWDDNDHDGNNDDEDGVCHGTGGSEALPLGIGVFQHPCQSHNNTFHEGDLQIAGHSYNNTGDDPEGEDSGDWGDHDSSPFSMAAFTSPLSGTDSNSDSSDSDFGDSSDSGMMSMLNMNHDENAGDVDQSSPEFAPLAGHTQMSGYSLGQS